MNSHQDDPNPEQPSPAGDATQNDQTGAEDGSFVSSQKERPAPDLVLMTLRDQLQELRQRFDATDAQIAGYLRDNAASHSGSATNGEAMAHVQASLERLLTKFDQLPASRSASADGNLVPPPQETGGNQEVLDALKKLFDHQKELARQIVNALAKRMTEELDLLRFQQIMHETLTTEWDRREAVAEAKAAEASEEESESLTDSEEETPPEQAPSAAAWSRAIWGPDLVDAEGFAAYLEELNQRLLEGDAGVATLAGQLLVFRQAPPEAKPQLLKDVGEAYYRTRIDEAQPERPFERTLIDWLHKDCDQAGLPNTIEVVHVGERFDKSRHSSTTRGGAEVSEVLGWIVLTEGGRVYTRASVAAQ